MVTASGPSVQKTIQLAFFVFFIAALIHAQHEKVGFLKRQGYLDICTTAASFSGIQIGKGSSVAPTMLITSDNFMETAFCVY